jgi:hypothetical protein
VNAPASESAVRASRTLVFVRQIVERLQTLGQDDGRTQDSTE